MKAAELLALLQRKPLEYRIVRRRGSHRHMESPGRPRVLFSYHDKHTVPPGAVRKILVDVVGLEVVDALQLIRRR